MSTEEKHLAAPNKNKIRSVIAAVSSADVRLVLSPLEESTDEFEVRYFVDTTAALEEAVDNSDVHLLIIGSDAGKNNPLENIRIVRARKNASELPCMLVCSPYEEEDLVVTCLKQGLNDFISLDDDQIVAMARIKSKLDLKKIESSLTTAKKASLDSAKFGQITKISTTVAELMHTPRHDILKAYSDILELLSGDIAENNDQIITKTKEVEDGGRRISEVIKWYRTFYEIDYNNSDDDEVDLNNVIAFALKLSQGVFNKANITLDVQFSGDGFVFTGNAVPVFHAFMGVVQNAIESSIEGDDAPTVSVHTELTEKEFIVTIMDNGPLPTEISEARMFTPFFTSKDPSKHLGVGLSNAAEFLSDLNCSISYGVHKKQSCFTMRFPVMSSSSIERTEEKNELMALIDESLLNKEMLVGLIELDSDDMPNFFQTQLEIFMTKAPSHQKDLLDALDKMDIEQVIWHSHKLNSMTGNFGALDLRKKFLNIEKSATNGNKESLAKHASDLVKDFEAVQAALKALCKPFK